MKLIIIFVGVCVVFLTARYLLKSGKLGQPSYTGSDPLDKIGVLPMGERIYQTVIKDLSPEWKGILNDLYPGGA